LREPRALRRHSIKVRCLELWMSKTCQVAVTEVVGKQDDYVGASTRILLRLCCRQLSAGGRPQVKANSGITEISLFVTLMQGIFFARRRKRLIEKCAEIECVVLLRPSRFLVARCVRYHSLPSQERTARCANSISSPLGRPSNEWPAQRRTLILAQNSLSNTAQVLVALALRQQHCMRNRRRQFRMRLAGTDDGKPVGTPIEPHGRVALRIRNDVVILARSLAVLKI